MQKKVNKQRLDWYKVYLEEYFETFKSFTKEDIEFFKGLNISNTKSYYVISEDPALLKKFACFYLLIKCLRFSTYMVTEYAENLSNPKEEDFLDSELVILYNHRHVVNVGGTENWLWKKVLSKVANRNRTGNMTILLTERDVPFIRNSREFIVLDLNNKVDPRHYITVGIDSVAQSEQYVENKNLVEVAQALAKVEGGNVRTNSDE